MTTASEVSTPMGRIVKQLSASTTKHYWYPGDKTEWVRAAVAAGSGAVAFAAAVLLTDDVLVAAVLGTSLTALLTGVNIGRRDARAGTCPPDLNDQSTRWAAVEHAARAAWRALVKGFVGAAAAVLILNLPQSGFVADWVLPLVPAIVGALAQQGGVLYEQITTVAPMPRPAPLPGRAPQPAGAPALDRAA